MNPRPAFLVDSKDHKKSRAMPGFYLENRKKAGQCPAFI